MALINNNLYVYTTEIGLTRTGGHYELDNRSMNTRELKLHKGLENTLYFRITDRDRVRQTVDGTRIVASIINPSSQRRLARKDTVSQLDRGVVKLVLTPSDLRDVEPGFYQMYLIISEPDQSETPLYSNQNNDVVFDIEITNQAYGEPVPTQKIHSFHQAVNNQDNPGQSSNVFVSDAFVGNSEHNYLNPQHSVAIYTNQYTGNITIQNSLVPNSPQGSYPNAEWSDLFTVNLSNASGIQHFTFTINSNWLRVVNVPQDGINANAVTQVQLRN